MKNKIEILDKNVYIDQVGKRHVKIKEGEELYAYLRDDGTYSWSGGFVGPSCGWKTIEPEDQSEEDKRFLRVIKHTRLAEIKWR